MAARPLRKSLSMSSFALPEFFKKIPALAASIPFLSVILLMLLMQFMKETYPFSHYPMYSGLTRSVEYYYLTNAAGEPIPQGSYFGFSTSWTKKMLNTRIRKVSGGRNIDHSSPAEITEAGRQTLQYLMEHAKPDQKKNLRKQGIQLHQVSVERKDNTLLKQSALIAELPPQ